VSSERGTEPERVGDQPQAVDDDEEDDAAADDDGDDD
jgi:hypothetical protein